jgi:hypothetical protein
MHPDVRSRELVVGKMVASIAHGAAPDWDSAGPRGDAGLTAALWNELWSIADDLTDCLRTWTACRATATDAATHGGPRL